MSNNEHKGSAAHIDIEKTVSDFEVPNTRKVDATTAGAIHAERTEKSLPLWTGLKLYRKAVFWSFAISFTLIMEGFQTSLLGTLIGLPIFRAKYGAYVDAKKGYQLTAQWQTVLGLGGTFGNLIGIFIASWAQDRYGYRKTIMAALVWVTAAIFCVFFAPNIQVLFVGEMISAGVMTKLQTRTDQWAYRLPFALQWIWPVPLFIVISFAPESPWFYVRNGRLEEAERSVRRLAAENEQLTPAETVAMMVRTNEHEKRMHEGVRYLDCFKGSNLRRTEIACVAWAATVLAGSSFANHPTYFLEQAGMSTAESFKINLGMRGLAFMGTLLSWVAMSYLGRRTMFLCGLSVDALCLLLIGILSFPGETNYGARWGQSALVMIWVFVWDFSVTVTAYAIVGEMSATRLRAKSVGLARNLYNVAALVCNLLNTYMVNSGKGGWAWKGKAGFFWFGTALAALVWAWFRLPETKGRSFRELDVLFERGVGARQFKHTQVDEEEG